MSSEVVIKQEKDHEFNSTFEVDDEVEKERLRKSKYIDLNQKAITVPNSSRSKTVPNRGHFLEEHRRPEGYRNNYFALNAYDRHKKLVNNYLLYYPGTAASVLKRDASKDRNDLDIVREHHRFVWRDEDESSDQTWEKDLAKKYYDKLFKEYGVCDLSKYKENKIAIRWRLEREVIDGKGQFTCAEKKCSGAEELRTWEVNFAYMEERVKKNTLVKLRLCPDCSIKLNFTYKRHEVTKKPKKRKHHRSRSPAEKKQNRSHQTSSTSSETMTKEEEEEEAKAAQNIWKAPVQIPEMKSRDDEFNEYLEDLFL